MKAPEGSVTKPVMVPPETCASAPCQAVRHKRIAMTYMRTREDPIILLLTYHSLVRGREYRAQRKGPTRMAHPHRIRATNDPSECEASDTARSLKPT